MKLAKHFIVEPGIKTHLSKRDPGETLGIDKAEAEKDTERHTEQLRELQDVLYADKRYALLVVRLSMAAARMAPSATSFPA
jgi:hypothetical protein